MASTPASASAPTEEMKAKVVLAGPPGVGKTSLVRRYVKNEFRDGYGSTLGAIVYKRDVNLQVGTRTIHVAMTLWDVMGQVGGADFFRDIDLFGAMGVLAVCDVTDETTVQPLRLRVDAVTKVSGDVPVQILLNKADLGPNDDVKNAGLRTGLNRGMPCYLTSAKSGDNVVAAFEDLARRIVERNLLPADAPLDGVDRSLLISSSSAPLTAEDVASRERIPGIFAEARLERLRRLGYMRFAALGLDDGGRPRMTYGRTKKPFQTTPLVKA
jgi:GTPase SAR1 family protein